MARKKQTPAQRAAKQRQRRYERQYEDLIGNFKRLYNQMQFGAKYGKDAPSAEEILKQAGTKSGLVKPSKASIKALKKIQSESGILRQAYWSLPDKKKEAKEKLKEDFEKAYEKEHKERRTPDSFNDWDEYYQEQIDNGIPYEEIEVPDTTNLEEMAAQINRLKDRVNTVANGKPTQKQEFMLSNMEDIIDMIREILTSNSARVVKAGEKGAAAWFHDNGNLELEDFYNSSIVSQVRYYLFSKFADHMKQEFKKADIPTDSTPDFDKLFKQADEFDDGGLWVDDDFI